MCKCVQVCVCVCVCVMREWWGDAACACAPEMDAADVCNCSDDARAGVERSGVHNFFRQSLFPARYSKQKISEELGVGCTTCSPRESAWSAIDST